MKIVSLSGGLGNQFFQYAMSLTVEEPIEIEWKLGFASRNSEQLPELFSFNLASKIRTEDRRDPTRFEIRVHHWLLAFGASSRTKPIFFQVVLKILASFMLKNYFGRF